MCEWAKSEWFKTWEKLAGSIGEERNPIYEN
jgi:hypothetical protein